MRRSLCFSLAFVVSGLLATVAAADDDPMAAFSRCVGGSWIGTGKGPNGEDFRTRVVYEWGFNKRLVTIKSYFRAADEEKQVYESVIYWRPGKNAYAFQSIAGNGGLYDGLMRWKADTLESEWTSYSDIKTSEYKQSIKFISADETEWVVHVKLGDEWKKIIESRQKRSADPKPGA